jgi:hypothetical protein
MNRGDILHKREAITPKFPVLVDDLIQEPKWLRLGTLGTTPKRWATAHYAFDRGPHSDHSDGSKVTKVCCFFNIG